MKAETLLENYQALSELYSNMRDELDRTRKELEQSETCCTEWEKQALDYKAENIALSGELERTRKALDVAKYAIKNIKDDMKKVKDGDDIWEIQKNLHDYCKTTLKQITALEQKE